MREWQEATDLSRGLKVFWAEDIWSNFRFIDFALAEESLLVPRHSSERQKDESSSWPTKVREKDSQLHVLAILSRIYSNWQIGWRPTDFRRICEEPKLWKIPFWPIFCYPNTGQQFTPSLFRYAYLTLRQNSFKQQPCSGVVFRWKVIEPSRWTLISMKCEGTKILRPSKIVAETECSVWWKNHLWCPTEEPTGIEKCQPDFCPWLCGRWLWGIRLSNQLWTWVRLANVKFAPKLEFWGGNISIFLNKAWQCRILCLCKSLPLT